MDTILKKFADSVSDHPDRPCFYIKDRAGGGWRDMTWREVLGKIVSLAGSLSSMGVSKGDLVAIYANTRFEWTIIDMALLSIGAVTVPIYHNLSTDQVEYILNHSSARVAFVENRDLLEKLLQMKGSLKSLGKIVLVEGETAGTDQLSLSTLLEGSGGGVDEYLRLIEGVRPDDLATCIYTSGTTGEPKGAELTHANISGELEGLSKVFSFKGDEIGLLFLPLAHVVARVMQFFQLSQGFISAYVESIDKLQENILEVRPHFMVVVPRVMEKIRERILERAGLPGSFKRFIFEKCLSAGKRISQKIRLRQSLSFYDRFQSWITRRIAFSKIRRKMGGRLSLVISGGAALDKDVAAFFHMIGISVVEGYGLTETMAAITINRPDDFKFGTVGKPLLGVKIRMTDDGEVLVTGPQIFRGYRKPVKLDGTEFDGEWFKTGDLGVFSREGFLRLTGRKKEIIVTAGGKNVAPLRVESIIRESPYIKDIVVYGDKRKYLSALVTVNLDRIRGAGRENETYQLIKSEIECKNKLLARHETIKKFRIIDHDFSTASGELTPTMKIRRHKVFEKYKELIEEMYKDD